MKLFEQKFEISTLSDEARGISYHQQAPEKVFFIAGALPGELVQARFHKRNRKVWHGVAAHVENPSKLRIKPHCPYSLGNDRRSICGGCQLQILSYAEQLNVKRDIFARLLERHLQAADILSETVIQGHPWNYRRKARLRAKIDVKYDTCLLGFSEVASNFVAAVDTCHVLDQRIAAVLGQLKEMVYAMSQNKQVPQIEVACGDDDAAIIVRHLYDLTKADYQLLADFAQANTIRVFGQRQGMDTVRHIAGGTAEDVDYVEYQVAGCTIEFRPFGFVQINAEVNRKVVEHVLAIAQRLTPQARILDLFAGIGNFSLPLARTHTSVVGVDGSENIQSNAQRNANRNQLKNVTFHTFDLFTDFTAQPWAQQQYDLVIIDPPRVGAMQISQRIAVLNVEYIVYISCNAATLMRDCALLVEQGYSMLQSHIADMFPHTSHMESITVLRKTGIVT